MERLINSIQVATAGPGSAIDCDACSVSGEMTLPVTHPKGGLFSWLMPWLRKHFSGKLVLVQIAGGIGAFAGRTLVVWALYWSQPLWVTLLVSQAGSCIGYISTYIAGYYIAFRRDYKRTDRSIIRDIGRLQLVEQLPNLITVVPALMMQGALMVGTQIGPMLAVNLGSLFGLHKIVNLMAMAGSNSVKKAMVDRSWSPTKKAKKLAIRLAIIAPVVVIAVNRYLATGIQHMFCIWSTHFV